MAKKATRVDLVVKSKIKSVVSDLNVSGDVADKLNERLAQMIQDGAERARQNGRRTLQARDL